MRLTLEIQENDDPSFGKIRGHPAKIPSLAAPFPVSLLCTWYNSEHLASMLAVHRTLQSSISMVESKTGHISDGTIYTYPICTASVCSPCFRVTAGEWAGHEWSRARSPK